MADPRFAGMTPYQIARTQIGVTEAPGADCNLVIAGYLASVGALTAEGDEVAWCSGLVNWCCENAGIHGTGKPNARSWLKWGQAVVPGQEREGDVCVLWRGDPRGWQGHVGFFVRRTVDNRVIMLGGNQGNKVCEASFSETRVLAYRRSA